MSTKHTNIRHIARKDLISLINTHIHLFIFFRSRYENNANRISTLTVWGESYFLHDSTGQNHLEVWSWVPRVCFETSDHGIEGNKVSHVLLTHCHYKMTTHTLYSTCVVTNIIFVRSFLDTTVPAFCIYLLNILILQKNDRPWIDDFSFDYFQLLLFSV